MTRSERATDLRRTAMDLLARREHSRSELRAKLKARGAASDDIEPLLDELVADGLQSDERYAQALAGSHARRGKGPLRIRAELRARGVDDAVIERVVREIEVPWAELAAQARAKRFGAAPPDTRDARAKQARFLEQRGFAAEHIRAALAI
jgi:regulatory protein